jgi:hypothetical protein
LSSRKKVSEAIPSSSVPDQSSHFRTSISCHADRNRGDPYTGWRHDWLWPKPGKSSSNSSMREGPFGHRWSHVLCQMVFSSYRHPPPRIRPGQSHRGLWCDANAHRWVLSL